MITLNDLCAHLLPPNERFQCKMLIIDEPHLILVAAMMSPETGKKWGRSAERSSKILLCQT